ncbi:MAG: two-component system response regulator [Coriobacteriaceae bacterium]|nr:two-component system response regulator [Coriobacteriaceae bacterium]
MARVLVVDDEPHIVRLVSFTLTGRGHEVITATDGSSGVDAAREKQPDLILMDVMMPEVTGLEALGRLKAHEDTAGIPVVMLSAKSQGYEQEAGLAAGAVRYVCKPFTPSELAQVVSEVLEQEERGRE